jgi:hypothetical protein
MDIYRHSAGALLSPFGARAKRTQSFPKGIDDERSPLVRSVQTLVYSTAGTYVVVGIRCGGWWALTKGSVSH